MWGNCNEICHSGSVFTHKRCKCSKGWTGSCCDTACNDGYYGSKCRRKCACEHGRCDHVTGNCSCFIGRTGKHCNKICKDGYYGYECLQKCTYEHGSCDHVTGSCNCSIGWTGQHCNITCSPGYFGQDCKELCTCGNGYCDHVTGNCTCMLDWIGHSCNISGFLSRTSAKMSTELCIWIAGGCVLLMVFVIAAKVISVQNYYWHILNAENQLYQNTIVLFNISGSAIESENLYHEYTVIGEQQRQRPVSDQGVRYSNLSVIKGSDMKFFKGSEDCHST